MKRGPNRQNKGGMMRDLGTGAAGLSGADLFVAAHRSFCFSLRSNLAVLFDETPDVAEAERVGGGTNFLRAPIISPLLKGISFPLLLPSFLPSLLPSFLSSFPELSCVCTTDR